MTSARQDETVDSRAGTFSAERVLGAAFKPKGQTTIDSIQKGLTVLDLGCGDGTTALPAAKLGAEVLGVDIARNLVDAGTRRAKEQSRREDATSIPATFVRVTVAV